MTDLMVHFSILPPSCQTSEGGRESFPDGLTVAIHHEIVPMGKDPTQVSYRDAGEYFGCKI